MRNSNLLMAMLIALMGPAFAGDDHDEAKNPEKPGAYKVGYRQLFLTNNAVTAKTSPADVNGRVLELSVWYPIDEKVAAQGIPLLYDESAGTTLNYGIPPRHTSHRTLLDVRVDSSSILPLSLTGPNILACDDPLGTACVNSTIIGLPVSKQRDPFPVVGFSHGAAASPKSYTVLLEHLASYGYIVVAPRHSGNSTPDRSLFLGSGGLTCGPLPIRPCADGGNIPALNRAQDISFTLDKLFDGSLGTDLQAAADPDKVGVFGHSFGGYVSLMLAGGLQSAAGSFAQGDLADPRIRAGVAMSGLDENVPASILAPALVLPKPNVEAIDIPMMIMVGEHESNILGVNFNIESQDFFNRLDTEKTRVKYRVLINDAVHLSFNNFCEQGFLDVIKLGNQNPSGADFAVVTGILLLDLRLPVYPTALIGKTDSGSQVLCRDNFLYEPTNRAIWDALTIPPPAPPGIPLGNLLFNNPPLSIPLENLPGFVDPATSQFVPTKTSDEVQQTTNGYLVSFFNKYLKKEKQYKHFLKGEAGKAEVEVCRHKGHKTKCKIVEKHD